MVTDDGSYLSIVRQVRIRLARRSFSRVKLEKVISRVHTRHNKGSAHYTIGPTCTKAYVLFVLWLRFYADTSNEFNPSYPASFTLCSVGGIRGYWFVPGGSIIPIACRHSTEATEPRSFKSYRYATHSERVKWTTKRRLDMLQSVALSDLALDERKTTSGHPVESVWTLIQGHIFCRALVLATDGFSSTRDWSLTLSSEPRKESSRISSPV
jgi:hypothetical protein